MRDVQSGRSVRTDLQPMDILELARQLHLMQLSLDGSLMTAEQLADMTVLGVAEAAAVRGDMDGVRARLAEVGPWGGQAAIDLGAQLAASAIAACRA